MCMTPHGPDVSTFEAASTVDLKPTKLPEDSLSFMFEVHPQLLCVPKLLLNDTQQQRAKEMHLRLKLITSISS